MDAEYTAWHQPPPETTESGSGGLFVALRRHSSGGGIYSSKKSGRRASGSGEVTLVRRFLSHRSSLSERSDGGSGSSRASITGMWATNAEAMQSRTASMGPLQPVDPLNLTAMRAGNSRVAACDSFTSSASSIASLPADAASIAPHDVVASGHHQILRRKSLKYAGKRVIMALRVKKNLPGDEKSQMIRLMLERYLSGANCTDKDNPEENHTIVTPSRRNSLTHQVSGSGLTFSLAPDL